MGRSRGGLSTKIHARVDAKGRPICLLISPGEVHDITCAEALLDGLENCAVVIADKGYDGNRVRAHIRAQGAIPNIPNRAHRKRKFRWKKTMYRERNHVERFSTNSSSSAALPLATTSSAPPSSLSSSSQPCEFGCDQLSPRPSNLLIQCGFGSEVRISESPQE